VIDVFYQKLSDNQKRMKL